MADSMMRYLSIILSLPIIATLCIALFPVAATAEELPDPTRPPAELAAPADKAAIQPAGLQSIIISETRRAAIIDGKTVELGGKYGDTKLIEVNEGNVVLRGAQGRQVMTLFPDVRMTGKQEIKQQSPAGKVQSGKRKNKRVTRKDRE